MSKNIQIKILLVIPVCVSSMYFLSNLISLIILGNVENIFSLLTYHILASLLWVITELLIIKILSKKRSDDLRYFGYLLTFLPFVLITDSIYRSFLRSTLLDVTFSYQNIGIVFFRLLESNLIIYSCLCLFTYLIIKQLVFEDVKLENAIKEKNLYETEFDKLSTVIPPQFLTRNIDRITDVFQKSSEKGENMITLFCNFLRVIIYESNSFEVKSNLNEKVINIYEKYLSVYLNTEICLAITDLERLYDIDKEIDFNDSIFEKS